MSVNLVANVQRGLKIVVVGCTTLDMVYWLAILRAGVVSVQCLIIKLARQS